MHLIKYELMNLHGHVYTHTCIHVPIHVSTSNLSTPTCFVLTHVHSKRTLSSPNIELLQAKHVYHGILMIESPKPKKTLNTPNIELLKAKHAHHGILMIESPKKKLYLVDIGNDLLVNSITNYQEIKKNKKKERF